MMKLIYAFKRKEGLSVEEFQRYWREVHGPIAAKIPGVRRYVQSHTLPALYDNDGQPSFDGAAEVWYDDYESFLRIVGSPEVQAAREDERHFIDHTTAKLFFTEEHVIVG